MKTLDTDLLAEMTRRLVDEFHPEQIILFGSHAWGTPDDDSDIDLLVIVPTSTQSPYQRVARAYRALPENRIAPSDILVKTRAEFDRYRHLHASLEAQIAEQGTVLYTVRMKTLDGSLLKEATDRLVNEFHPERIFLFGSHAWGKPDEGSDVDLIVVVSDSDLPPHLRAARAYRALRGLPMPIEVRVRTRAEFDRFLRVPASLERQIAEEGELLYG